MQWKMTLQPRLCVKSADNSDKSYLSGTPFGVVLSLPFSLFNSLPKFGLFFSLFNSESPKQSCGSFKTAKMIILSSNLFLRQVISLVKMKRFCTLRENSSDHIVASHDHPLIKGEKKQINFTACQQFTASTFDQHRSQELPFRPKSKRKGPGNVTGL